MNFTAGSYFARLTGGILGQSSSNKKPQWVLTWNITHQAVNGNWEPIEPTDRRMYLSMSGGAIPYTEDKLVRLGFNGNFASPEFHGEAATSGQEVVCSVEEYDGKLREKWDLPRGASEVEPAPDAVVRQMQAQWNQRHKAVQRPAPAKPAAPKPAAPSPAPVTVPPDEPPADEPPTADSIPF